MTRRRLPIGIQTFRKICEQNCYYVDKTPFIKALIKGGSHYFLSRPRRFGKSLFLDTLKELFEGSQSLFEGLAIHDHWDWSIRHPVLRLSFGSGNFTEPGDLNTNFLAQLDTLERQTDIKPVYSTGPERFANLLRALHDRTGQRVVVLVDEYDKPVLDTLDVPAVARANRDYLRGIYSVIKDTDAHIRFAFLTGVSKFSKVSLFSGLNNLGISPSIAAIPQFTAIQMRIWTAFSHPNFPASTVRKSGAGTMATVGEVRSAYTIRSTFCCSLTAGNSRHTGSKPNLRRFWLKRCSNDGSVQ